MFSIKMDDVHNICACAIISEFGLLSVDFGFKYMYNVHSSIQYDQEMALFLFMCTLFEFICDSGRSDGTNGKFGYWIKSMAGHCCTKG